MSSPVRTRRSSLVARRFRGWHHDVRTASEVAHARPGYAAGFRAALATVAPMILDAFVTLPPGVVTWTSLSGMNGTVVDRGGPYRLRAAILGGFAIGSAFVVTIGSLLGNQPALAVFVTFNVAMMCGLARSWTDLGPGFGVVVLVSFAIAVALPSVPLVDALLRGLYVLIGGAWAMLLALVLWPLYPYRPVRLRVAECYRAIARYMEDAAQQLRAGPFDSATVTSHVVAVRSAIEAARDALAITRRGRSVETGRGERLLVLHEVSDQMFAHVIALFELSTPDSPSATLEQERLVLSATLDDVAATMRAIANTVQSEIALPHVRVAWDGTGLRAVNDSMGEIVDHLADYAVAAVDLAESLNTGAAPKTSNETIDVTHPVQEPPSDMRLFSLDAFLHPAPVVRHHALRVAIVTSIAVAIAAILHLDHGYWVTLTAVVILQPFAALTRQRAVQRVVGTILGGLVAAGVSALFHGTWVIPLLIALFTTCCVALLPLNYGWYAVFGTPAFVLLAELSAGNWHLAGLRVINTLLGGGLALAGSQFLWPGDERNRLPELLANAIRANADFLRRTIAFATSDDTDLGVLREPRRAVGNAALDAEDSLQRLMSEHRGSSGELEALMAMLVYVRRLAASTAALAIAAQSGSRPNAESIRAFANAANATLTDVADAIAEGRAPTAPPFGSNVPPGLRDASVVRQRLVRLARQIELLRSAAMRALNPDP